MVLSGAQLLHVMLVSITTQKQITDTWAIIYNINNSMRFYTKHKNTS